LSFGARVGVVEAVATEVLELWILVVEVEAGVATFVVFLMQQTFLPHKP
jgi:hypothetical protein